MWINYGLRSLQTKTYKLQQVVSANHRQIPKMLQSFGRVEQFKRGRSEAHGVEDQSHRSQRPNSGYQQSGSEEHGALVMSER